MYLVYVIQLNEKEYMTFYWVCQGKFFKRKRRDETSNEEKNGAEEGPEVRFELPPFLLGLKHS